jgi:sugar O-acyltransferase (sialic acid O-acetyltransferase NeuD family)
MTGHEIAVYGGGGFAREVAWLAEDCGYAVACFIDDDVSKTGRDLNEIPVLTLEEAVRRFRGVSVVTAVGSAAARETMAKRAMDNGFPLASLVHPRVEKSRWITLGKGVVICAGTILTTNIVVGDYVQLNLDCTIGHDVRLGDYATLAPGVHVSGYVYIGRRVYIGTGAVIINGTESSPVIIGDDAVVGAGACVTRSVDPATTVVGVPAKPLAKR